MSEPNFDHLTLVTMPEAATLATHLGHELAIGQWGKDGKVWNLAITCETCQEIVLDYDVIPDPQPEPDLTEFEKGIADLLDDNQPGDE